MTRVRQRLLLIAGWVLAAVGSGLIATGAVAVAGGQVTDRTLRPLSAAEVEALLEERETNTAFASGGSTPVNGANVSGDSSASELAQSSTGDEEPAANPPETRPDSGPSVESASPSFTFTPRRLSTSSVLGAEQSDAGPIVTEQERTLAAIYQLDGGSVAVAGTEPQILLLWATPHPGFVGDFLYGAGGELVVSFTSLSHRSRLVVEWISGELVVDIDEAEPL